MLKAQIFAIQRFSLQDGPGIRTTVFFKGCPLTCEWCCNPESQNPYPELMHREQSCQSCGACLEVCPHGAIDLKHGTTKIDRALCDNCFDCVEVCCSGALEVTGKTMTIDDVFHEVMRDSVFYKNSQGGVTLSGGEPLIQIGFVKELLKRLKMNSVETTLDTSGFVKWEYIEEILPFTDRIMFDLKHLCSQIHKNATGVNVELILDNLEMLVDSQLTAIWIRIPLIPQFNDSDFFFNTIVSSLKNRNIEKISLLPYHLFGKPKYKSLGKPFLCIQKEPPDELRVAYFKSILEQGGFTVSVGV